MSVRVYQHPDYQGEDEGWILEIDGIVIEDAVDEIWYADSPQDAERVAATIMADRKTARRPKTQFRSMSNVEIAQEFRRVARRGNRWEIYWLLSANDPNGNYALSLFDPDEARAAAIEAYEQILEDKDLTDDEVAQTIENSYQTMRRLMR